MAVGEPGHVARTADRLAGGSDERPLAAFVAPDGTGRTETLDAVAGLLAERDVSVVRIAGRRADRSVPLGALAPLFDDPPTDGREARAGLVEWLGTDGSVLVVDDGHLLDDESAAVVQALVDDACDGGFGIIVATSPVLAGRDDPITAAIGRAGTVVRNAPLDDVAVRERIEPLLGAHPDPEVVDRALARAAGHARLTDRLVAAWRDHGSIANGSFEGEPDPTPREVVDSVAAVTADLTVGAGGALTALSIGPALDDELLASLCDVSPEAVPALWQELRAAGLLVPGHEEPVPIVADAVTARIDPASRRELHRRIAERLAARGAPAAQIADHLVAAESRGTEVGDVLVAAGTAALAEAPEVAADLLARAVDIGVDPLLVAGLRAEAAALAGNEDAAIALADAAVGGTKESMARAEIVLAGILGRRGLWARALRIYDSTSSHPTIPDDAVRSLGVVASAAIGHARPEPGPDERTRSSLGVDVIRLLGASAAAAAANDGSGARRAAGEAADLLETVPSGAVLPETPHGLGALIALALGDHDDAERLASRALELGIGGSAAAPHHRLLVGLAALRAGRWDRAQASLDAVRGPGTTRDALVRAALAVGLARRLGDVGRLRGAWESALPVLAAVRGDLYLALPLAELVMASARLGQRDALVEREAELDAVLAGLGDPGLWSRPWAWARVEAAVAADDAPALDEASAALRSAAPAHPRLAGLDDAATAWTGVLAGDATALDAGVVGLEQAGLVWEASRLVGQAAIRAEDPGATRSLLGRARELHGALPVLDEAGIPTGTVLSEREREVAACVVDGLTYKEIGGMLFISPKTVEHHVARIRQKLGASTRAEMLAGLRTTLAAAD
jgi:DNA-binding CsgD family transcriptional regulator/tetratricopeptide (TPR) repeat protein